MPQPPLRLLVAAAAAGAAVVAVALPLPCPNGTLRAIPGGSSVEDCDACTPGSYCGGSESEVSRMVESIPADGAAVWVVVPLEVLCGSLMSAAEIRYQAGPTR